MKRFYWKGISHTERMKAISEITAVVDSYAIILNFQQFSDMQISMMIEIVEKKVNPLYAKLQEIILVDDTDIIVGDSNADCILFLSITFTQSTGDLRIEVPMVGD